LQTRSESVLLEARAIAIMILCRLNTNNDLESQYEASCWVDGISKGTLKEFCNLVQDSGKVVSPMAIELVKAWRNVNLPNPVPNVRLSILLMQGLKRVTQSTHEFGFFIVQVLARCLLACCNPLPLAVMTVYITESTDTNVFPPYLRNFVEYTRSLVFYDHYSGMARSSFVTRLLKSTFAPGSYPLTWFEPANTHSQMIRTYFNANCLALAQQVVHLKTVLANDNDAIDFLQILRQYLCVAIVVRRKIVNEPIIIN
jgi:hypothetical protein